MVRGTKSKIDPYPLRTLPPCVMDKESGVSKKVAIMSGLSETEDRINKV